MMLCQPSARLQAVMTVQIVRGDENIACRIIRLNLFEQRDVIGRVARGSTAGLLFAIMHP
jgi:hypothetical protein